MSITTTAIFENGVLRPTQPIALDEGAQVEVTIFAQAEEVTQSPADILAEIAALPSEESHSEPFSGTNHDALLYNKNLA